MNEENALDSALSSFVASITEIFPNLSWGRFLAAVGIIVVVIVLLVILRQLMRLFATALAKWGKSSKSFENQFRVAYNIIRVILIVFAVLTIMQVFGINVSAIVAGLGIASVIVGLVLQETLRDIVMSIRIVMDGYFRVGDVIRFNDIEGEVISMSSQTTMVRDLANGDIHAIGNHNFTHVTKVSDVRFIDIGLSYEDNPERIAEVLTKTCKSIAALDKVRKCEFKGLQEFGSSAVVYRILLRVNPLDYLEYVRKAKGIIRKSLLEAGLEIPYGQLDIHVSQDDQIAVLQSE